MSNPFRFRGVAPLPNPPSSITARTAIAAGRKHALALCLSAATLLAAREIVGAGNGRAVPRNGVVAMDMGTLGGANSYAVATSSTGLVGFGLTEGGLSRAVLWHGTGFTDLNSFLDAAIVGAGRRPKTATGINNGGSITGIATVGAPGPASWDTRIYPPVPVPAPYALLATGLAIVCIYTRRSADSTLAAAWITHLLGHQGCRPHVERRSASEQASGFAEPCLTARQRERQAARLLARAAFRCRCASHGTTETSPFA